LSLKEFFNQKTKCFLPDKINSTVQQNRNCIAAFGGSGYEKSQSGLRPLCGFSLPQMSVTAKTLYAIVPKYFKIL
jgi:hypothetical protein